MKSEHGGYLTTIGGFFILLGIFASIIIGIIFMGFVNVIIGLLIAIIGSLTCFISGILFCALSELLDTTSRIAYYLNPSAEEKYRKDLEETKNNKVEKNLKNQTNGRITTCIVEEENWICPECCRELSKKISTCKCGYKKK